MITLLALETATNTCSVAVAVNDRTIIEISMTKPRVHAESLIPMIKQALEYTKTPSESVDAIAVSYGPGSYTGLRIGVSSAKGFSYAHQTPLIAIPTLDALALSSLPLMEHGDVVAIALNARKDEVYLGVFKKTGDHSFDSVLPPVAVSVQAIGQTLLPYLTSDQTLWIAGEGSSHVQSILSRHNEGTWDLLPDSVVFPSAKSVAILGLNRMKEERFEDIASFEPLYIKDFEPKKRTTTIFDRLPF